MIQLSGTVLTQKPVEPTNLLEQRKTKIMSEIWEKRVKYDASLFPMKTNICVKGIGRTFFKNDLKSQWLII